ncbi:hypothetical protein [Granulosicoccus antarcticus]|uniref:Lipoprotein n=1 Tax=Granulosicoccus antarcticus IMCC3135 TaxID=1192854 RepID=A0A2Z2NQD6_9GAMM|nr:hypothetical protein [Granulosicoccus antarcticus]ASJ73543.1 hypothetical protein IMCC3135_17305 [Granulosicoccus antarcticus IMCC3135]
MKYMTRRVSSVTTLCVQIGAVSMLLFATGCASTKEPEQQVYMLRSVVPDEEVIQGSVGLANAKMRIAEVLFLAAYGRARCAVNEPPKTPICSSIVRGRSMMAMARWSPRYLRRYKCFVTTYSKKHVDQESLM